MTATDSTRIAFVCVQNAGRSQMAMAFAERERGRRNADHIDLLTGGTNPAERVHENVAESMAELGIDITGRDPHEVTPDDLAEYDYVITMGCDANDVCPFGWGGESRDWDLDDPHGKSPEEVREIRDEIERRVVALFDELA
ncbi:MULTISPECIES: low molecular weight phosphatase family protein [unclassified Haladaptatus]|uniref:arsenate-mycothiol transferase ArsC n=1 Tax=unclassified Haladaptatus TaxID=2622732 RepID=UPI0023E8894B|nr:MULTISPECIES: low molecular weight phosphatase family protein [unclassified Haladaptatus]